MVQVRRAQPLIALAAVALTIVAYIWLAQRVENVPTNSYLFGWFGVLAVVGLWLISAIFTGTWNPLGLAMGADNRLSTSKFQILLWTATVGFVYAMAYAIHLRMGSFHPITNVPQNVLIALGISATSAVAAQAITSSQVATNPGSKSTNLLPSYDMSALVQGDDASMPSITKVQLLFWTAVAIAVYLISAFKGLSTLVACPAIGAVPKPGDAIQFPCTLPDIDTALLVFMGLGHGTYLGAKLASASQPTLTAVAASKAPLVPTGYTLTITGTNLGTSAGTVTMDGTEFKPDALVWSTTSFSFNLPQKSGSVWKIGDQTSFAVSVSGAASAPVVYTYPGC